MTNTWQWMLHDKQLAGCLWQATHCGCFKTNLTRCLMTNAGLDFSGAPPGDPTPADNSNGSSADPEQPLPPGYVWVCVCVCVGGLCSWLVYMIWGGGGYIFCNWKLYIHAHDMHVEALFFSYLVLPIVSCNIGPFWILSIDVGQNTQLSKTEHSVIGLSKTIYKFV